jgi:hypothetical protein
LEQFSVVIDNYGIADGKYFYFNLPSTPPLMPVGADHRALPLLISQGSKNTVNIEVDLPADFSKVLIAPKSEHFAAGAETARLTTRNVSSGYVITDEFETAPAIVSPGDYQAMLNIQSALDRKSSRVFLLEQK